MGNDSIREISTASKNGQSRFHCVKINVRIGNTEYVTYELSDISAGSFINFLENPSKLTKSLQTYYDELGTVQCFDS